MSPLGLAWRNLLHKAGRTAVAAAGVAFAVVLVFMELGLLDGVGRTAGVLYDNLRFDLLLTSSEYLDVARTGDLPRGRLAQARAADGVAEVLPLSLGVGTWRQPARRTWLGAVVPAGGTRSINVLAAPPDRLADIFSAGPGRVFESADDARAAGAALARLDTVLFDIRSKPEFGRYDDLARLPASGSGEGADRAAVRFNGRRVEVVGRFRLGTGFSWNGMLMTGEETFGRLVPQRPGRVTFGLVNLAPGADVAAVQRSLRAVLPPDVQVLTRAEMAERERRYWLRLTSVGQFLLMAVVLAVVVGVIFVYQMMAADIRGMLPEYATVKALGYRPGYLTGAVLWQAVLLAGLGYVPGLAAALGLYAVARAVGGIPVYMTPERAAVVLALTAGMCLASGLLALRKVHTADPADLF
jgi:putative ABC transport system permease protein